jgi:hypothetical protein
VNFPIERTQEKQERFSAKPKEAQAKKQERFSAKPKEEPAECRCASVLQIA